MSAAANPTDAPRVPDAGDRDSRGAPGVVGETLERLRQIVKRRQQMFGGIKIFISYRRRDVIVEARLIANELAQRFGEDDVFMDIDDVDYGDDFAQIIDEKIGGCDVLVAVIGPAWTELLEQRAGKNDYVRHEIASALARGMRVIPVLVGNATPTLFGDLPPELAKLKTINALALDTQDLNRSITKLDEAIRGLSYEEEVKRSASQRRTRRAGLVTAIAVFMAASVALLDLLTLETRAATLTMWLGGLGAATRSTDDVVLVTIDGDTEKRVGREFGRTWRHEHARLIDRLSLAGARTVAFDMTFKEPMRKEDEKLARAVSRAWTRKTAIVVGVDEMENGAPRLAPVLERTLVGRKVDGTEVHGWGIACAGKRLGLAHAMPLAIQRDEKMLLSSFALAAFSGLGRVSEIDARDLQVRVLMAGSGEVGKVGFSLQEEFSGYADASGQQKDCPAIAERDVVALKLLDPSPAGFWLQPGRRLAYEKVLDGEPDALAAVKGKIVLVGLSKPGTDEHLVADGPGVQARRFGIELYADQLDEILRGDVVWLLGWWQHACLLVVLGLSGAYTRRWVARWPAFVRRPVVLGLAGMYLAAVLYVYRTQHLLLNVPYELGAFALAYWVMRFDIVVRQLQRRESHADGAARRAFSLEGAGVQR